MKQFRLLTLLALLMTAATGAWAQDAKHLITATYDKQTRSLEQPLPYATTVGVLYEAVTGESFNDLISRMSTLEMTLTGIGSTNTSVVSIGELNGASTPVTVNADGKAAVALRFGSYAQGTFVSVTPPLYVTMKDGVKDADKWTVKVGEGQAQALPIGGLKGDGSETVTLQYTGRLKVKGVKATSDEKPAAASLIVNPEVGQIIGSDGKNYDANATLPSGVTAVAMIAYVGSDTGVEGYTHGLALALTDEASTMSWTDATGASGAAAHTPAAPTTTSSWMLPSKDQWNNMIDACKNVLGTQNNYQDLRDGFSGISGASNLQSDIFSAYYWSSTEYDSGIAWGYGFGDGDWFYDYKINDIERVRACLAF